MTDRPILFSAPMINAILREIAAPGTGKTLARQTLQHKRSRQPRSPRPQPRPRKRRCRWTCRTDG